MNIANVQGAHLTATDKRNIRAILTQPAFTYRTTYTVRRKSYRITEQEGTHNPPCDGLPPLVVHTTETTQDPMFGRPVTRTRRSTFTTRDAP